jgi:transcriptional regulator with XRE-family HTH domain
LAAKRLKMSRLKEILRLSLERGLSQRKVARALRVGNGTVSEYLGRASARGRVSFLRSAGAGGACRRSGLRGGGAGRRAARAPGGPLPRPFPEHARCEARWPITAVIGPGAFLLAAWLRYAVAPLRPPGRVLASLRRDLQHNRAFRGPIHPPSDSRPDVLVDAEEVGRVEAVLDGNQPVEAFSVGRRDAALLLLGQEVHVDAAGGERRGCGE